MINAIENNEITVGIFVHLANTVSHNILLSKLYHYRIRGTGTPYELLKSYLNDRSQYVYVNDVKSHYLPVTWSSTRFDNTQMI